MMRSCYQLLIVFVLFPIASARGEDIIAAVEVDPPTVRLNGVNSTHTLLIHGKTADGRLLDLTHSAEFRSLQPEIASVSPTGLIRGLKDGTAQIEIKTSGKTLHATVAVEGTTTPRKYHFENDIVPLLSRFGCNFSGCHGKAEGQNGFKLSVFGSDPPADLNALTKEGRGRRVYPPAPELSLLLSKISGQTAHGGGVRIPKGTSEYETIRGWIAVGTPRGEDDAPHVESIRIEPRERLLAMRGRQQLRVIARWTDGRETDATAHARFQSNNDALAGVSAGGLVLAGDMPGDVAVMASYMNAVDTFRAFIPRGEKIENYPAIPENNFIDKLVFQKLRKLNVLPSELADDAEFVRRVYLDVIGTLPTADEARRFLADSTADKRMRLVDELLERPEFADFWALKWSDLLRVDRQALGHKRAYSYYKWIRDSFAGNQPLDRFARELLTADGPLSEAPPGAFYKVVTKPGEMAGNFSQVFLGVRIGCAECHHHPFDRWSQNDYFGMQAYFTQVGFRNGVRGDTLTVSGDPVSKHPRTGVNVHAHALGTTMPNASPTGDRRSHLADWLTSTENAWFARNLANRTWAHFLGRGLVEPVDDVRDTNPPTNPELLDALARHTIDTRFDFRKLIRTVVASRVYQLASKPNPTNAKDEQNYSRALLKRVDAEVLLDMVCQVTGVEEKFDGVPAGSRAIQLWDSKVPHYFLKLYGRPSRTGVCECERVHEPSVAQVLHILNSTEINAKLSNDRGIVAKLTQKHQKDPELLDELYLTYYNRFPTTGERDKALAYLAKHAEKRREAVEDLAWSLLNSLEFSFNH